MYENYIIPAQYTAEYDVVPIKLHIMLLHESDINLYIGGVYFTKCFATLEATGSKMYFNIGDIL